MQGFVHGFLRGSVNAATSDADRLNHPFTINVHHHRTLVAWGLEKDGTAQSESISRQGRQCPAVCPTVGSGLWREALDLVYQAAEVFTGMEDHAREIEARAKSMCKNAAEKLRQAEKQIEVAERLQREIITEADCRLQDASRALKQAQSRIADAEDRLTAMEFRAQAAEAEAREAKQALALVEEAIRRRLLCANPEAGSLAAVAQDGMSWIGSNPNRALTRSAL